MIFSKGSRAQMAFMTVRPPNPESKMPILDVYRVRLNSPLLDGLRLCSIDPPRPAPKSFALRGPRPSLLENGPPRTDRKLRWSFVSPRPKVENSTERGIMTKETKKV